MRAPATTLHDMLPPITNTVTFIQTACSCGWVSDRWGTHQDAIDQFAHHVHISRVVVPLFR